MHVIKDKRTQQKMYSFVDFKQSVENLHFSKSQIILFDFFNFKMDFLQQTLNSGGHLHTKVKEIVANLYNYFSMIRDERISFPVRKNAI